MSDNTETKSDLRFFSSSAIIKNEPGISKDRPNLTPFGLGLQEPVPDHPQKSLNQQMSHYPSVTNMPTGPDSSYDIDWDF